MDLYRAILIFLEFIIIATPLKIPRQLSITSRIVGGKPAEKYEIPYQVSIRFKNSHFCGGSLLTMRHVLTAAHCLFTEIGSKNWLRFPDSSLTVFAGDIYKDSSDGKIRKVLKTFVHPDYKTNSFDNDIAIIKLKSRFEESKAISAIQMRNKSISHSEEALCQVSGWGSSSQDGESISRLMKVQIPIYDHTVCKKDYDNYSINIDSKMICAGYKSGGKDSCKGDSGGPLVCDNQLTGIVSFGKDCGLEYPGVYMEVFKYRSWILRTVNTGSVSSLNIYLCALLVSNLIISFN